MGWMFRGFGDPALHNKNQYACRFLAWQSGDPALKLAKVFVASIFRIMEYLACLTNR
jgi:hypothetical protein